MTVRAFTYESFGASWNGTVPQCPECEERLQEPGTTRGVPLEFIKGDGFVSCPTCGASYPIAGETVELTARPAQFQKAAATR